MAKHLYILRHAEAENTTPNDRARELTARGQSQAQALRDAMGAVADPPSLILYSPARRVTETVTIIAEALPAARLIGVRSIYNAEVETLWDILHRTPDDCDSLMLAGHNPGMHCIVTELLDHVNDTLAAGYPPAGLTVMTCAVERWADLAPGQCALRRFYAPD